MPFMWTIRSLMNLNSWQERHMANIWNIVVDCSMKWRNFCRKSFWVLEMIFFADRLKIFFLCFVGQHSPLVTRQREGKKRCRKISKSHKNWWFHHASSKLLSLSIFLVKSLFTLDICVATISIYLCMAIRYIIYMNINIKIDFNIVTCSI